MITYLYWILVIGLAAGLLLIGVKVERIKPLAAASVIVLVIGSVAYYFHFQQIFVKRWGGVMRISVPEGQLHITATWKDENLWVENYDPETNTCHFNEYSRGNLLEGRVTIRNCNPLRPGVSQAQ